MEHEHNHQGCCEHKNVKWCKKCGVVYCVDCGHEWAEKCTLNHYYPWYPQPSTFEPLINTPYSGTKCVSTTTTDAKQWTYTKTKPDNLVTLTCNHN
jgi:hypothetical protein